MTASPFLAQCSARGSASIPTFLHRNPEAPARSVMSPTSSSSRRREDHDAHVRRGAPDLAHRRQPVHARHDQVHDHDVRVVVRGQLDRLAAAAGLGDHRDARQLQDVAKHATRKRIVVRDDHAQRRVPINLEFHPHEPFPVSFPRGIPTREVSKNDESAREARGIFVPPGRIPGSWGGPRARVGRGCGRAGGSLGIEGNRHAATRRRARTVRCVPSPRGVAQIEGSPAGEPCRGNVERRQAARG